MSIRVRPEREKDDGHGYHLCQRIKTDPILKSLPVVLFSSLITDKLHHKGESVGADAQWTKPSPAELVNDLKRLVIERK